MDYLTLLALAFAAGVASRPNLEKLWRKFMPNGHPMRRRRVTFAATAPAFEPSHRLGQWQLYTHAFMLQGELCKRPLSWREMRERTGLSQDGWREYLTVLEGGRVIAVRSRAGAVWLMGKADRRKALPGLPFPSGHDAPAFATRKRLTDSADSYSITGNTA